MKKMFLLFVALSAISLASAQTYQTFLKVTHVTSGSSETDEFSFEGGEIFLQDNDVLIYFAEAPTTSRSYEFDNVRSFAFETRLITAIGNPAAKAGLNVSVDKDGGILRLRSGMPLDNVSIWSISGSLLDNRKIAGNEGEINISTFAPGVYIVQSGAYRVKFVK
jgi:hypothetical protein